VFGEEFEVEELEVRNMNRHKKVVMVKKEDAESSGAEDQTEDDKTGGTGAPPSYQVSGGGSTDDGGEPEAGAQTDGVAPLSYTFASLIIALFLVVFG